MFTVSVVCGCGVSGPEGSEFLAGLPVGVSNPLSGPGGSEFLVGLLVGVSNPFFSVSVCWVSLCPPVRSLQYRDSPSEVFGVCWLCVASGRGRCSLVADGTVFGCVNRFCCAPGLGGASRECPISPFSTSALGWARGLFIAGGWVLFISLCSICFIPVMWSLLFKFACFSWGLWSVCFVALKCGGSVDVRFRMYIGGSRGSAGARLWGPLIVVVMFSSGTNWVEDPNVSLKITIGPFRRLARACMYISG